MKKLSITLLFFNVSVAVFAQQCVITATATDSSKLLLSLSFVKYVVDKGSAGSEIFIEYPTQLKNPTPVSPKTKITVKDSFDSILIKSGQNLIDVTVLSTRYAINRFWIESCKPGTSGRCELNLRDGRIRFLTVDSYVSVRNRLLACPGGYTFTPLASNGLTMDGDTTELGGRLNRDTYIEKNGNYFQIGGNTGVNLGYMYINGSTNQLGMYAKSTSYETDYSLIPDYFLIESNANPGTHIASHINAKPGEVSFDASNGVGFVKVFKINKNFVFTTIPDYASDSAADADTNLQSGSLYRLTGDRNIKVKP